MRLRRLDFSSCRCDRSTSNELTAAYSRSYRERRRYARDATDRDLSPQTQCQSTAISPRVSSESSVQNYISLSSCATRAIISVQRLGRISQMRKIHASTSAREKSRARTIRRNVGQYFKRPSRVAARPARPSCRAMYIHSLFLDCTLSVNNVHTVNATRDGSPARHVRSLRRHEYIFVILYFELRSLRIRRLTRPAAD